MTDDVTNDAINVSSYTVTCQLRRSYIAANAVNVTCIVTDAANGAVTLSLTEGETANLKPGSWVFDVKAAYGNTTSRVLDGIIRVIPGITR